MRLTRARSWVRAPAETFSYFWASNTPQVNVDNGFKRFHKTKHIYSIVLKANVGTLCVRGPFNFVFLLLTGFTAGWATFQENYSNRSVLAILFLTVDQLQHSFMFNQLEYLGKRKMAFIQHYPILQGRQWYCSKRDCNSGITSVAQWISALDF